MAAKTKRGLTIRARDALAGYMFLLPWLAGLLAFSLYPVAYSLRMSVSSVTAKPGGAALTYAGLVNYAEAINVDVNFKGALLADVQFIVMALVIVMVFSLVVAVLLNGRFRFRAVFRVVFFLPVVIMSGPVLLELMGKIDNFNFVGDGLVYTLFELMPAQVAQAVDFVLDNLVAVMWFSGVQVLIFLAGLQKIDRSVYEAAEIDGAGAWESFWKITLPHMKALVLINAIYTVMEIANFSGTGSTLVDTGASVEATTSMLRVNRMNAFIMRNITNTLHPYSFSAAASWLYFIALSAVMLAVLLVYKFFDRRD
ncbi:MAG: sugar ABC transporter permease [Clostridiales bacterium]|jgi:ABC-type sugar transport system permease subunit|nr:sugar ABC transporter permease [Clostridiales bacterium]